MLYEEIRIKQGLCYISFCPLRILYNSIFIIMATSFGTNAVVVTRVHCTNFKENFTFLYGSTGLLILSSLAFGSLYISSCPRAYFNALMFPCMSVTDIQISIAQDKR